MDHILEDEILERLPVNSLFRFKCVSKQWKSMIESSHLAKKRLDRHDPQLFVLRSETSSTDQCSRTVFLESNSHEKIIICSYKIPDPHNDFYFDQVGRVMGYCDGLVCIYHFGYIYLINLTTRQLKILSIDFPPDFLPSYISQLSLRLFGVLPINIGFGKDILTETYKVILMYSFCPHFGNTLLKTEVFNLNTGTRRCVCCPIHCGLLNYSKPSIFASGSLFWLTFRELAAMDLHTETFRYVLLPSWYTDNVNIWSLKDRLCLSDVLQYPDVDVWSLQQENPSVKWEKVLSVNILSMDRLDANFWKLGLAASYYRPTESKPSKSFLEQIHDYEHSKTVLYTENLVSSGLGWML